MSITAKPSGSYPMPSLEHARVADAMHPGIFSCEPDASLPEVARMMAAHHVHCIAVVGVSHQDPECGVWAIISDLDLVEASTRDGHQVTARELATEPLVGVEPQMPLRQAAELMLQKRTSHAVVIEPDTQRPIGILSTIDIAWVLAWTEG
jgi:CBS domain-containing protein